MPRPLGPIGLQGPAGPDGPAGGISVTGYTTLGIDKTTNSAVLASFLSLAVTTAGGDLVIMFTVSASNDTVATNNLFALFVDGVQKQTAGFTAVAGAHATVSMIYKIALAAGGHTVLIKWAASAGILQCKPTTVAYESASIYAQEVTV